MGEDASIIMISSAQRNLALETSDSNETAFPYFIQISVQDTTMVCHLQNSKGLCHNKMVTGVHKYMQTTKDFGLAPSNLRRNLPWLKIAWQSSFEMVKICI
ncbi:hypothetical protein PS1_029141 [Malus domestica]